MSDKFRIMVVGIGGVGGYLGARLASGASADTEVIFIARGDHEKAIRERGLTLVTAQGEITARPSLVTSRPQDAGSVDLIICCVKNYDLDSTAQSLKSNIGRRTIVLPLQNGVSAAARVSKILPEATVWESCVYIISRITAPGVVTQTGAINRVLFGDEKTERSALDALCDRFRAAGIDAAVTDNSRGAVWEKFVFLSPIATTASYLDKTIGQILESESDRQLLTELLLEVLAVARDMNAGLPESIEADTLKKLAGAPYETVPSMLADFRRGSRTELDALTLAVVSLGNALGIPTPRYVELGQTLSDRISRRAM